jgi:lipopolysaccharide export system protein LptA
MYSCGSGQSTRLRNSCARLLLILLCLPAATVSALPDDRNQPIHITADKALRDEVKGITIYSGSVQLVQGSMELDADKLTIYHATEAADEIIAEGRPAKMRQQPELDKGIVHAHARVITYFKNEDRIHLQTDARIEQEGAVVEGDAIDYFIAKQLITAESDTSQEDNKVVVVIPPSPQKEAGSEAIVEQAVEGPAASPPTEEAAATPSTEEITTAPITPPATEEMPTPPVTEEVAEPLVTETSEAAGNGTTESQ